MTDPTKYEDPQESAGAAPEELGFEPVDPDGGEEEEAAGAAAPDDQNVAALRAEVERALFAQQPPVHGIYAAEAFTGADNIVGVGLGAAEVDLESVDPAKGPGGRVLNVYVAEPATVEQVRRTVVDRLGVRALSSEQVPINVIRTGPIEVQAHRHRERPSPNGISVGHVDITAGTQGCLARGRSGDRRQRLLMLSNNHVLADVNAGNEGDAIVQPGPLDGGQNPRDRIAVLERFVTIRTDGQPNYVDCATGWCWHQAVRREFIYRSGGEWRYFRVGNQPRACRVGMLVAKSGRTTQLTVGRITDCNASLRVDLHNGRFGNFRDQIAIRGLRGDFSAGGDSGSLIWTWDGQRNPVGLLFAGGGGVTFANKIQRVLDALDIELVT